MAARKRKTPHSPSAADFTIVLEDLRSQFKVFGEALETVREEMGQSVTGLREEIGTLRDEVRSGFKEVDGRLGTLERDMLLVKTVVVEHSHDLKELRDTSLEHGRDLKELRTAVDRLTEKVDHKVDRAEVGAIVEGVLARPRSH